MSLELRPVPLRECRRFIAEHHRHNLPPAGWLFGVSVVDGDVLVGVGVASRPVAHPLQDGFTVEIVRTCTDGTMNANSMIYGALCRAAKALGYRRAFTYTLASESGASVRAAGFELDAELAARSGASRPSLPEPSSRHSVALYQGSNHDHEPGRLLRAVEAREPAAGVARPAVRPAQRVERRRS